MGVYVTRANSERAIRLIEQFEPLKQERAAGYALDAMADDAANDDRVIDALLDLHDRGFHAEEFRDSAARAIEKIGGREPPISDDVIGILIEWLRLIPDHAEDEDIELTSLSQDDDFKEASIIWGYGRASVLPAGNFNILSALASILLKRKEPGRDRYLEILKDHLSRERNPNVWKALLNRLGNAGGSTPGIVSGFLRKLFGRFPQILETQEAIIFFAYAQCWDDQIVFDLISSWPSSGRPFLQRAYGELVGLVAIAKEKDNWAQALAEIVKSGNDEMKIGLAYAAVNMWTEERLRSRAGQLLVSLLNGANKRLVAATMDVFRVADEFAPDTSTVALLRALADTSTDLSAAPSHFVVEHLQSLLPHEAELIAKVAEKLLVAWRGELGDMRTGTVIAAPQLTDLALTLHRLGGPSRQSGVRLFEAMIEIDAYGARETLDEIDGRFVRRHGEARPRLPRHRSSGRRRTAA